MRTYAPVTVASVVGLLASYRYVQWLLSEGWLKSQLQAHGHVAYWSWLFCPIPVLLLLLLFLAPPAGLTRGANLLLWAAVATAVYLGGGYAIFFVRGM